MAYHYSRVRDDLWYVEGIGGVVWKLKEALRNITRGLKQLLKELLIL